MAFFVGQRDGSRVTYFNVNRARSISHDQTSVDRARWTFRFGLFTTTTIAFQQDSDPDAYNKITQYFVRNSSGV